MELLIAFLSVDFIYQRLGSAFIIVITYPDWVTFLLVFLLKDWVNSSTNL